MIRPQDDAATTSQSHPRGRRQLLQLRPMGSSGGGERAGRLPPEASLDKPPTVGRVLPGGHPNRTSTRGGRGKNLVLFLLLPHQDAANPKCVTTVCSFNDGEGHCRDVQSVTPALGKPPEARCPASSGSAGQNCSQAWRRSGHLRGNGGPTAPAGSPSSEWDTPLLSGQTGDMLCPAGHAGE